METIEIHKYRNIERSIQRVKTGYYDNLESNIEIILEFVDYLVANGFSNHRINRYLTIIPRLGKWLGKNFKKASKKDMLRVFRDLERRSFSAHTKATYKAAIKRFYKWLLGDDEVYPKCVSWVKANMKGIKKHPKELLTKDDVEALIKNSLTLRDKAFISLLWETGCRIGEIGGIKIKHVTFDEYGGVIIVDGKTGTRRLRFVKAVPYLSAYLNIHPNKDEPSSALWLSTRGKPMRYSSFRTLLIRVAKRAGVKKKVNPHAFRHARATLMSQHFTDAQMKAYFGWTQGSDMANTYIHLSGRDVDNALLEFHGLKKKSKKLSRERELPVKCDCGTSNPVEAKFCYKCGQRLVKESEKIGVEQLAKLLQDKDMQDLLKKKLASVKTDE